MPEIFKALKPGFRLIAYIPVDEDIKKGREGR